MPDKANPNATVLMSVFDGEKFLAEAIESILSQTYTDYEFLIIDDGSSDHSWQILQKFALKDNRIKLLRNEANIGLTNSLNIGLKEARGDFIVRQDADDISLPSRVEKQIGFMHEYTEVVVCGSWVKSFNGNIEKIWRYPALSDEIRCRQVFENSMAHPSVVLRKSFFDENKLLYDPAFRQAQDYDLWVRTSGRGKLENIQEPLVLYRQHPGQVRVCCADGQNHTANQVRRGQLRQFGLEPSQGEMEVHGVLSTHGFVPERSFLNEAQNWLLKLLRTNRRQEYLPDEFFLSEVSRRWQETCFRAIANGLMTFGEYWRSDLSCELKIPLNEKLLFVARCVKYRFSQ